MQAKELRLQRQPRQKQRLWQQAPQEQQGREQGGDAGGRALPVAEAERSHGVPRAEGEVLDRGHRAEAALQDGEGEENEEGTRDEQGRPGAGTLGQAVPVGDDEDMHVRAVQLFIQQPHKHTKVQRLRTLVLDIQQGMG